MEYYQLYGFTKDPKTSDYMLVMDHNNDLCLDCSNPYTYEKWCKECNAKALQQDFSNWTSENKIIDKFIQIIQLNYNYINYILELIPYNKLENIEYLDKDGFDTLYKALWLDGPIKKWSYKERKWIRSDDNDNKKVVLKSFNKSSNLNDELINKV